MYILFCTLGYNPILHYAIAQIIAALAMGTLLRLTPVSFRCVPILCFFEYFLPFWYEMLEDHFVLLLPQPKHQPFLPRALVPLGEGYSETKLWMLSVLAAPLLLGLTGGQVWVSHYVK